MDSLFAKGAPLRKGKWTMEEEAYAGKIIHLFNKGILTISNGTTLRSYLSQKLYCDPMRITKKFAGASCIGKQVYQNCDGLAKNEVDLATDELRTLEESFRLRLLGKEHKKHNYSPSKGSVRNKVSSDTNTAVPTKRHSRSSRSTAGSNTGAFNEDYYYDCEEESDDWGMDYQSNITSSTSEWLLQSGSTRPLHRVMSDSHLASSKSGRRGRASNKNNPLRGSGGSGVLDLKFYDSYSGSSFSSISRTSMKRSFSTMDMAEYEAYAKDDNAAVDLLMKFIRKVKTDSESTSPPTIYQKEKYAEKMRTYSPFSGEVGSDADNEKGSITTTNTTTTSEDGSTRGISRDSNHSGSQDGSTSGEKESGSEQDQEEIMEVDSFDSVNRERNAPHKNETPPDTRFSDLSDKMYNFGDIKTFSFVSTDNLKASNALFDEKKQHDRSMSIASESKGDLSDGASSNEASS